MAVVDSSNAVAESDESNNFAVGPVITVLAADADVAVSDVVVPGTPTAGHRAVARATVTDVGNAAAAGTVTAVVTATPVDAAGAAAGPAVTLASVRRTVRLKAKHATSVAVPFKLAGTPVGRYQLTVQIVPSSLIDADETDNAASVDATLR